MRIFFLMFMLLPGLFASGQNTPAQTAKTFIRQGDYNNAILVLNRAIENDRGNIELVKDLAFAYYLHNEYQKAFSTIRPITDSRNADPQSFQIQGMILKALNERKEAERTYRAGLKKFDKSGVLYNDYGELLWSNAAFPEAASQWQKGIKNDPDYPGNYFNAARYYYMSADKVWGLIYGEIFVNLESYSKRTPEMKMMLLEGYKKLFSETDMFKNQDTKNEFVKAYLETMKIHSLVVSKGINPDALAALRTRFILTWFEKHSGKFPYRLFDYHKQLARDGMFDAYNQWIFGAASNLRAFQQWTVTHSSEYEKFTNFQKNRVFRVPEGQYYRGR